MKKKADMLSGFAEAAKQKKAIREARMKAGKPVSQGPEVEGKEVIPSKTMTDKKTGNKFRTFARLKDKGVGQKFGGGKHRGME